MARNYHIHLQALSGFRGVSQDHFLRSLTAWGYVPVTGAYRNVYIYIYIYVIYIYIYLSLSLSLSLSIYIYISGLGLKVEI